METPCSASIADRLLSISAAIAREKSDGSVRNGIASGSPAPARIAWRRTHDRQSVQPAQHRKQWLDTTTYWSGWRAWFAKAAPIWRNSLEYAGDRTPRGASR